MNLLKLLLYTQLIFLTVTFCICYKFSCHYRYGYFNKKCYLLLSVTEESYRSIFLCIIPRDLKSLLLEYTAVDRFQSVGLLTNTNALIKHTLTKNNLRCVAVAFGYRAKNLAGVLILQSEIAVKNYIPKYDVDINGKRICHGNPGYLKRKWIDFTKFFQRNRSSMRKIRCRNSCSKSE